MNLVSARRWRSPAAAEGGMALFDRTARHLARGPAVLFPADPADAMAEAVLRYDPAADVDGDRFVFRNDVQLHGPVGLTPDAARHAGLPAGLTTGYYASIVESGTGRSPRISRSASCHFRLSGGWRHALAGRCMTSGRWTCGC